MFQHPISYAKIFLVRMLRRQGFIRLRYRKLTRIFYFKELFDRIRGIEGDVVECGVAFGGGLVILGALAKADGKGRKVYGFDSFDGFPEPVAEDKSSVRDTKKGEYKDATIQMVRKAFRWAGVEEPILKKGFVEETALEYEGKIAFLHIDVDLYGGYKAVLEHMYDKVVSGGIVAFDEYHEPKFPGATKAVDEFFGDKKNLIQKSPYINKYFLVKP